MKECIHCPVCDTMCGFGGAGAFSDGKFNFTTQFGGWLTDFMDAREVMELIDYVDSINVAHGATTECFSTATPEARALERRALAYDLHLLQARCKHLGTENNLRILQNIYEGLQDKLEFRFNTAVTHIARAGRGLPPDPGQGRARSPAAGSSPPPAAPAPSGSPTSARTWAPAHQQPGGHRRAGGAARPGL